MLEGGLPRSIGTLIQLQRLDVAKAIRELQHTLPRQMWSGIRQEISPTILSAATILVLFSVLLLTTLELLRRRSERLRGITPH